MAGEEGVDGTQAVDDAFGVIEALDADPQPYLLGEAMAPANGGTSRTMATTINSAAKP